MLTANKIPDNHINFWDEIFKAGDEVLNNLLKAATSGTTASTSRYAPNMSKIRQTV